MKQYTEKWVLTHNNHLYYIKYFIENEAFGYGFNENLTEFYFFNSDISICDFKDIKCEYLNKE